MLELDYKNQTTATQRFEQAYTFVIRNGWSVIPLRGASDVANPKAPALPSWKTYQTRKPHFDELETWFKQEAYGAIGVVLGAVSGIVVVDIDDPQVEHAFRDALPHLTQTFTVRSGNRKLPHYYYTINSEMHAPARMGKGIEFRSDGQYVVAPNTNINGATWRIENPFAPLSLTESDLEALYRFLGLYTRKSSKKAPETPYNAESRPSEIPLDIPKDPTLTVAALETWYSQNARLYGRNNALYAGACWARDMGWSRNEIERALVTAHVTQPANGDHLPETTAMRMTEARRTITSAFARPPTPRHQRRKPTGQLPNAVREHLLQMGHDNTARVLDALLMVGIAPDTQFTAKQAYEALADVGIGKNAVYVALATVLENGQSVFPIAINAQHPLPPHPLPLGANAVKDKTPMPIQCLNGRGTKAGKNRGRPQRHYIMPSAADLCTRLKVRDMGSDKLTRDDLRSVSAYRMGLHRALVARAPKQYGRDWQARRLGVDKKTMKRYDKACGIRAVPVYESQLLNWFNCEAVCPKDVEYGIFVTDHEGKRHPAKLKMVQKLLAQKYRLTLHRQVPNYYHMPAQTPMPAVSTSATPSNPDRAKAGVNGAFCAFGNDEAQQSYRAENVPIIPRSIPHHLAEQLGFSRPYPKTEVVMLSDTVGQYALPLPQPKRPQAKVIESVAAKQANGRLTDAERVFAEAVYGRLREISIQHSISKKLARELVQTYGTDLIRRGLEKIGRKTDVKNVGGYLRVWLRVQKRLKDKS